MMEILFLCPLWGSNHIDFDTFTEKVKTAGYDGVEMSLPEDKNEGKLMVKRLRSQGLLFVGQHWQTMDADLKTHKSKFEKFLYDIAEFEPLFINSHTGRDFFTFEQNSELIETAAKISENTGAAIYHETHRGRFGFAAHITKQFLETFENLKLALDISHWIVVSESLLENQAEAVKLALERTFHIHTRIGFAEGPQVNDPRAPEWHTILDQHLHWWDKVIENAKKQNRKNITITPEFGPVPYMPTLPFTQMPVASQWDVNIFMKDLLQKRYCQNSGNS